MEHPESIELRQQIHKPNNRLHSREVFQYLIFLALFTSLIIISPCKVCGQFIGKEGENVLDITRQRAAFYEDCGKNASRLLKGWLDLKQDPETKLFTRGKEWNYHNEGADHYSSLVLLSYYTDPKFIEKGGLLHQTLANSQRLCSTQSGIPTVFSLETMTRGSEAQLGYLAEWLRDGLIRITEIMGTDNDWYREMERLTGAMLDEAERRGGINEAFKISYRRGEDVGNMLQTLARLYAMSGNERFLHAAETLADANFVNGDLQVIRNFINEGQYGIFLDHGSELIPGLSELFALESQLGSPKAKEYEKPLRELLDEILKENAHPSTGLFCTYEKTEDGRKIWNNPADTWGYLYFAYENYDRGMGKERYTEAIKKPIKWLLEFRLDFEFIKRGNSWPHVHWGSDDWSDSYESMVDLWNKYPDIEGVFDWLEWSTHFYHRGNKNGIEKYGPYTGRHFDGSLGRTLCSHMMVCTQGVRTVPFAEGLRLGGIQKEETLYLSVESDKDWNGRLCFDGPRTEHKAATLNWARINMMPQWFVARPGKKYNVTVFGEKTMVVDGQDLIDGLPVRVVPGQIIPFQVTPL